jgi:serine/threonine-protein kinase
MIGAGQQIGGYTVLNLLGRGGMGEVYLAQHRRVARRAAIKVLIPELSQNAAVLERFFNEARAASLIRHPGIVEILDCDLYLGQAYIVMELLDGESFGGYLYRTGPLELDLPFLLGVGASVAGAVGAAHATGIVHRDLKPDNIHLHLGFGADPAVAVKILDFGIAKLALQDGRPSQTSTGVVLGTPTYMSPEQCRGAGRVDARSDVYSLGCIFYEATCGFPPFVGEGMGDLIVAHVSEAPVPPIERVPSIPPALNDLILRMLAKSPDERPQTMNDVVVALRECARQIGVSVDGPLRPRIPVERPATTLESAVTQPPPAGPSGVETTPLGPRPRAGAEDGAPSAVAPASSRSGAVASGSLSAGERTAPRGSFPVVTSEKPMGVAAKSTTLSTTAAELTARPKTASRTANRAGRWVAVVAAAAAVAGGGGALWLRGRSTPVPSATAELIGPPPSVRTVLNGGVPSGLTPRAGAAAVPAASPPPAPSPTEAPAPGQGRGDTASQGSPPVKPAAAAPLDSVRIDFQGLPAGTTALVDGQHAAIPLKLPRGSDVHRILLRPPGQSPRTIELDGSRDRIVDFVATTETITGGGARGHSTDREGGARRPGASPPTPAGPRKHDKGPSVNPADREAITDI